MCLAGATATQGALLTALSCSLVFGLLSPLSKFLSNSVFAHLFLAKSGRVQAVGE